MKKKMIIYIVLVIAAVLAILIVTKQLPPAPEEESAGTIGKVNKYRKVQMTEKDIILRSEFVKDTSALAKSIQGLLLFNAFAKDYAAQLKSWTDDLEKDESSLSSVKMLKDYYTFLNNNVASVENTISVLAEFYTGDTTEMSLDVEKKLADFYLFASHLFTKDSAINTVIPELEKKISNHSALNDKKDEEVKRLKAIHDQMLLKTLQVALLAGNKKSIDAAMAGTLYNSSNLQAMGLSSKSGFQNISLGAFLNKNNLGPIHYSQTGLNPVIFSQVNLGPAAAAQEKLGPAVASQTKLGPMQAQEKLGPALAQVNLGPLVYSTVNFGNAILNNTGSFGNITLGPALFNSTELQNYIQSSIGAGLNSKLENTSLMNMEKLGPL